MVLECGGGSGGSARRAHSKAEKMFPSKYDVLQ